MIFPNRLCKGDTIGVMAPAGLADLEDIKKAIPFFENLGLKEENLDVKLVSFSVDPEFDSPEVLKQYGESYEADFTNWSFLTGYDFDTIKELSIKSFKNLVVEPKEDDQVMHGTSFFLVSPEGEVIKNYSGVDATEIDSIVADLKELN